MVRKEHGQGSTVKESLSNAFGHILFPAVSWLYIPGCLGKPCPGYRERDDFKEFDSLINLIFVVTEILHQQVVIECVVLNNKPI